MLKMDGGRVVGQEHEQAIKLKVRSICSQAQSMWVGSIPSKFQTLH